MASTAPLRDAHLIPMTYERALTAVTQARAAVVRAHREMAEALEIIASRQESGWSPDEAAQTAAGLLHLASTLKQLDTIRTELLAVAAGGSSTENPATVRPHRSRQPIEPLFEGEFPPIEERLVVSPGWGHLHRRRIREGRSLVPGAVIGEIRAGRIRTLVRTPAAGIFVSWLVSEGDTVDTGRPLARMHPNGDHSQMTMTTSPDAS